MPPTKKPLPDTPIEPVMTPEEIAELMDRVNMMMEILLARQQCHKRDLAAALGVDPSVLSKRFSGERSWKVEELVGIAKYLKVEPAIWFANPDDVVKTK